MAYLNSRSQERDNQNSLRKFPFSDAASCTNGTCVITPGAVIDAQLYIPGRSPAQVWVSSIDDQGKLHFSDSSGEFAETSTPATANAAVPVTFTGDGGPLSGGVVVFGNEAEVGALLAYGGQSFSEDQTAVAPAAVTYLGLPGVTGFKLDDGNVVYGAVKIRGANGCDVATYTLNGVKYLRISAIGKLVETVQATGFIKTIVAHSNNLNFTVNDDDISSRVINICATGVSSVQDEDTNADQETTCAAVRKTIGTVPSERVTATRTCEDDVCSTTSSTAYTITLKNGSTTVGTISNMFKGTALGTLQSSLIPTKSGSRFTGYFDAAQTDDSASASSTSYTHSIVMSGTNDTNVAYTAAFSFTNTTSTPYTTTRQIADALRALGYEERTGIAATGSQELAGSGTVASVCGYSSDYCDGNDELLQQLNFLDSNDPPSLVFAVPSEDVLTDTVTAVSSGDTSSSAKLYYRYDGTGVGKFTASENVTLYAHWMPAESTASVSFNGYGTLHLAAPSTSNYSNPIQISGCENPVPTVGEVQADTLTTDGADKLAEIVLHPSVPSGEVHIGIRGLSKAYAS